MKNPDDPMASMPEEVLDFEEDLKPWLQQQIDEGKIPEVQQADEKISLVWHSGAGIAMRAMDLLYSDSDIPREQVIGALENVLGPITTDRKKE